MKPDQPFAAVILVSALPVLILVALLIRATSPGPVLVTEELHFDNAKTVRVFRFRTSGNGNQIYAVVSEFLERWAIDRLPALWNVVRGDFGLRRVHCRFSGG